MTVLDYFTKPRKADISALSSHQICTHKSKHPAKTLEATARPRSTLPRLPQSHSALKPASGNSAGFGAP